MTSVTSLELFLAPLSHLGLGLLQPVRHPHLAEHRRRGGEMCLCLVALAGAPVELAVRCSEICFSSCSSMGSCGVLKVANARPFSTRRS